MTVIRRRRPYPGRAPATAAEETFASHVISVNFALPKRLSSYPPGKMLQEPVKEARQGRRGGCLVCRRRYVPTVKGTDGGTQSLSSEAEVFGGML